MAAKEIAVKKYVARLSGEQRERLEMLIRKGKSPARGLVKVGILLKADVSDAGAGWSDNRIIRALDVSASLVYRVHKQLAEEGFEAELSRKQRATPAAARIFDRSCCRWRDRRCRVPRPCSPIAARSSARGPWEVWNKPRQSVWLPSPTAMGHPAEGQQRVCSRHGGRAGCLHAAT
jgi:hypothetical protein